MAFSLSFGFGVSWLETESVPVLEATATMCGSTGWQAAVYSLGVFLVPGGMSVSSSASWYTALLPGCMPYTAALSLPTCPMLSHVMSCTEAVNKRGEGLPPNRLMTSQATKTESEVGAGRKVRLAC